MQYCRKVCIISLIFTRTVWWHFSCSITSMTNHLDLCVEAFYFGYLHSQPTCLTRILVNDVIISICWSTKFYIASYLTRRSVRVLQVSWKIHSVNVLSSVSLYSVLHTELHVGWVGLGPTRSIKSWIWCHQASFFDVSDMFCATRCTELWFACGSYKLLAEIKCVITW